MTDMEAGKADRANLNSVSGALVDSGVPVPDEAHYGDAIRTLTKERDTLAAERDALHAGLLAVGKELIWLQNELAALAIPRRTEDQSL